MSQMTPRACPHEPRPGTTVCLHCRREARLAARKRRRGVLIKSSLVTFAVAAAVAAAGGLAVALAGSHPAEVVAAAETALDVFRSRLRALTERGTRPAVVTAGAPIVAHEDAGRLLQLAPAVQAPPAPALPPTPPLLPIVAEGATRLRDSVVAIRKGESVTVHFDTRGVRTRRPEKFEQIVRSTLPAIYGPMADSVLEHIPQGDLARGGDLITELPTRGVRLALGAGWTLALWPATRPGQDGPLVVMYRAQVTRLQ